MRFVSMVAAAGEQTGTAATAAPPPDSHVGTRREVILLEGRLTEEDGHPACASVSAHNTCSKIENVRKTRFIAFLH